MGGSAPVPVRIEGRMMDILIIIQQPAILPQIETVQLTPQPPIRLQAHLNKQSLKLTHLKDNLYSLLFEYDSLENCEAVLNFNAQEEVFKGNETIILSCQSSIRSLPKGLSEQLKEGQTCLKVPLEILQQFTRGIKVYDLVVELYANSNKEYRELTYVEYVELEGEYEAKVLYEKIVGNGNTWLIDALYENEERCVVCMDERRPTVALSPCMHECLCEECGEEIKERRVCPICRTPIKKIIRV